MSENDDTDTTDSDEAPAPYVPRDKHFYGTARALIASSLLPLGYSGGEFDAPKSAETADVIARFLDGGVLPQGFLLPKHQRTLAQLATVNEETAGKVSVRDLENRRKALKLQWPKGAPKKEHVEREAKAALDELRDVSELVRSTALTGTCLRISAAGKNVHGGSVDDALGIAAEEVANAQTVFKSLDLPVKSMAFLERGAKEKGTDISPQMVLDSVPYPASYGAEAALAIVQPAVQISEQATGALQKRLDEYEAIIRGNTDPPATPGASQ